MRAIVSSARRLAALVAVRGAALLIEGCATTRSAHFGQLPDSVSLVTLVVSEDHEVVARECRGVEAAGQIMGGQLSWPMPMPGGEQVRAVKVVRYTDSLPSQMAFEIDVHELCHTVAVLQGIADPCHVGNGGFLLTGTPQGSGLSQK
ncbi:MAG: hypothetical protein HY217_13620 [Candidatus Rokubacteria bacterium]|nr:hypothetical protein [Candidatus Rokubacteria bacterium]